METVKKRVISVLLMMCMVFSMPGVNSSAQEINPESTQTDLTYMGTKDSENTGNTSEYQNADYMTGEQYKELGFSSLKAPEAFDENDTSNPLEDYSPSILSELYMARGGYDTNYGVSGFLMENAKTYDDLEMSKFVDNKLSSLNNYVYDKNHKDNYNWQYQSSATVAIKLGDLSTEKYIKDSIIQNSMFLDKKNKDASTEALVLYTFNDDKYDFEQQCIVTNVLDQNSKFVEDIQIQDSNGYLAIAVGDYNSDNYNEVAVYIPCTVNPKINIYKQKEENGKIQLVFDKEIILSKLGGLKGISSKFDKCDGCNRPIVSLSTTNISGKDDLVINVSLPYSEDKDFCYDGITSIYNMSNGNLKEVFCDSGSYSNTDSEAYRMKFTASTTMDIDGNGTNELVIAGNRNTKFSNGSKRGDMDSQKNLIDVVLWDGNKYCKAWSKPQEVQALDFIKKDSQNKEPVAITGTRMNSTNEKETLFVEGVFYTFVQGDGNSADEQIKNGEFVTSAKFGKGTGSTNAFVHLAVSASFVEENRVAEQTLVIYGDEYSGDHDKIYLDIYWCYYDQAKGIQIKCIDNDYFHRKDEDDNATLLNFCPVDVDNDTVYMKYTNKTVGWSNPQVYSVMLSAPYWSELDYGSLMSSRGQTSFSVTTGTSSDQTTNWNVGLGASVSIQAKCTFFGNGGKFGVSADAMWQYTGNYQKSNTKSETLKFDAGGGEDYVALMTVPIAVYHYNVWVPEHMADEEDIENYKLLYPDGKDCPKEGDIIEGTFSEMCVNVQFNPAHSSIPVSTYNKVIEEFNRTADDANKLKLIDLDSIYKGRDVGDPSTYASNITDISSLNPNSKGTLVSDRSVSIGINGKSNMSPTLSEGTSTRESHGFSYSLKTSMNQTVEFGLNLMEIVDISGSATLSEAAAFGTGSSWASSNSESMSYATTFASLPASAQTGTTYAGTSDSAYAFMAKMVKWTPDCLEKGASVIGCLVEGADGACPALPKDFYVAQTSDTSATLRWNTNTNYTRKPYAYKIYYSKSASGEYLPVTENGKDVIIPFKSETYTVTGLKKNTTYYFKLQAYYDINDKKSASTLGPYAYGKTKGDEKEPNITKPPVDIYRNIGDSAEFTINVSPTDEENTIYYQWQKLGTVDYYRSDWKDIQNADNNNFNAAYFAENGVINDANAGDLDRTVYRCCVMEELKGVRDYYNNISRAAVLYIGEKDTDHIYNKNGFCMQCGFYQPAEYDSSAKVYKIKNAGQLFWFASMVNGDRELAEFDKQDSGAKCIITADIDLEGREWKPINSYKGTFDGQNHTVSALKITKTSSKAGLFGSVSAGTIKNLAVKGDITLESSGSDNGGIAGYADGATISNVSSYVNIKNTGKELKHVGGIIGTIENNKTVVEKCVYYGQINLANSVDCIGGVVAYTNGGGRISNCANLGTVTASKEDAYIGGILGYLNNSAPTIKNCYNYGKVSNGGKNTKCGAVIGWVRKSGSGCISDNYYLDSSASLAFGSSSKSGLTAVSKNEGQFASGEVAFLINNSVTTGKQVWYQTIGEDKVPVLDNTHKTVYKVNSQLCPGCKSEAAYSNINEDSCGEHNFVNGVCTYCGLEITGPFDKDDDDNFIIRTYDDLVKLSEIVRSDYDIYGDKGYVLGNNIIAPKDSKWKTGIGSISENKPFNGTFNGNGYCIIGLNIDLSEYGGLFEIIGEKGNVSNLFVTNYKYVSTCENAGSIAAVNNGTIEHCTNGINVGSAFVFKNPETKEPIKASELNSEIKGTLSGGIAARNAGMVIGCRNAAVITGTECGGIAGINTGKIYGCANNGTVGNANSSSTKTAGGIVGKNGGIIESSYNSEKVYGKSGSTVGSIAGLNGFDTENNPKVNSVFYITINGLNAAGTDSLVKSVGSSNVVKKQSEMKQDTFTEELNKVTDDTVKWCRSETVNKGYPRIENNFFEQTVKTLENGITLKGSMHSSLNISYKLLEENSDEYNTLVSDITKAGTNNENIDTVPLKNYGSSSINVNGEKKVLKGYSVSLTDKDNNPILAELWIQGDIEISVPAEHENVSLMGVGSDGRVVECEPESFENGAAVFKMSEPISFILVDKSDRTDSNTPADKEPDNKKDTVVNKDNNAVKTGDLTNLILLLLLVSGSSAAVIILWRRRKVE